MSQSIRTSAAVMKLWHTMKADPALQQLAATSPDVALETVGTTLPEGIGLEYEPQGDEHRITVRGLPDGAKSWIFDGRGGMRIEAEANTGSDELSVEQLDAVAGGSTVTQSELDGAMSCCWTGSPLGGTVSSWCYPSNACGRGESMCYSKYFSSVGGAIPC